MTAASLRGPHGPLERTTGVHIFWSSLALLDAVNVRDVACGKATRRWLPDYRWRLGPPKC
jgi:hypothetical protein